MQQLGTEKMADSAVLLKQASLCLHADSVCRGLSQKEKSVSVGAQAEGVHALQLERCASEGVAGCKPDGG